MMYSNVMLCYNFFFLYNFSVVAYNILVVKMVFTLHLNDVSCYQSLLNLYSTKGVATLPPTAFAESKFI